MRSAGRILSIALVMPACLFVRSAAAQNADTPVPPAVPAQGPGSPQLAPPPPPPVMTQVTIPAPPPPVVPAPPAPVAGSDTHLDVVSLQVLRARGTITEAEYQSAIRDISDSTGQTIAADAPNFVLGKWSTTLYGFVKSDFIYDSTQSFGPLAGNTQVQRPSGHPVAPPASPVTYQGDNGRAQFSMNDTRFGLRLRAPEFAGGVRASGQIEMDFFGQVPSTSTEGSQFASPGLRMRHGYMRIETPIVDILFGQYWHLFGWQNVYHPASVQAQGLAGQLYARDTQVRISKTIQSDFITVEAAVAGLRPPQRDSGNPQAEAGLRMALNKWTGVTTTGATGTGIQPLSVAVTGNFRDVSLPEMSLLPAQTVDKGMFSVAVDGYIPIIPASKDHKDNGLSVVGEFVSGNGIADLYSGLTGALGSTAGEPAFGFPHIPNSTGLNPAPTYPQNIDTGLVALDKNDGSLHAIKWTSLLVGVQYYLPFVKGRAFIAANYSHMESSNSGNYTDNYNNVQPDPQTYYYASDTRVRKSLDMIDVNLFVDVLPPLRLGAEVASYRDKYVDGTTATNLRLQMGAMYLF